jgi:hypothetical protein
MWTSSATTTLPVRGEFMVTYVPHSRMHGARTDVWRLVAVVLTAVLVGLGAWMLLRPTDGRTADEALVDEIFAALEARDGEAIERLFTSDAVVTFGPDDPGIVGIAELKAAAIGGVSLERKAGEVTTLVDPPTGFTKPDETVDQHYVVVPALIHDDPFVIVFDVRDGKVATQMLFEPFEPIR